MNGIMVFLSFRKREEKRNGNSTTTARTNDDCILIVYVEQFRVECGDDFRCREPICVLYRIVVGLEVVGNEIS